MAVESPQSLLDFLASIALPSTPPEALAIFAERIQKKCLSSTNDHLLSRLRSVVSDFREQLRIALIVVDFQNDFVSGSLSILNGSAQQDPMDAIPTLNRLLEQDTASMVIYTLDWHPANHISFVEHANDADRLLSENDRQRELKAFDLVRFEDPETHQVLYPSHCVAGSWGAELHPDVKVVENASFVKKGTDIFVDSYSGFTDNNGMKKSELESLLRSESINALLVCGLAYDICVMFTAKDAAKLGFLTSVISDCSAGLSDEKIEEANAIFAASNVPVICEQDAEQILSSGRLPLAWIQAVLSQKLGIR